MSVKTKLGTVAVLFLCGCSSSGGASGADASADGPTSGPDAGAVDASGGDASGCDASPGAAGVTGTGKALGYDSNLAMPTPIEGVAVCVLDHCEIPCVTSDSAGQFALPGIPPGADVAITFTKTGYYGALEVTHSPTTDFELGAYGSGPNEMITLAYATQFFASAGWTYPSADKGVLFAKVAPPNLQNACTGLDQTALAAGSGGTPVYGIACAASLAHDGPGTPDPALAATSAIGEGFFLAAPGPIDMTATHPTLNCSLAPAPAGWSGAGWASTKPHTVSAILRAGYMTKVVQQCN